MPAICKVNAVTRSAIALAAITPEMLASRQNNAADFASWIATQSTRFGSAATAYGAYLASQPHPVSQTGAAIQFGMAGTATAVGFGAGAMEQLLRPDVGQTAFQGGIAIAVDRLTGRIPILAPALNELGEVIKATPSAHDLQNKVNGK